MRRWVLALGLVAGSAVRAPAGTLTNDFSVAVTVDASGIQRSLSSFGSASAGGFNATNGSGAAEINWQHGAFGIYASGATNTISEQQSGGGQAYGNFFESIEITPQQGHVQGEPGILFVPYHLSGSVDIAQGGPGDIAFVDFGWDLSSVGVACGTGPCDDPFASQVLFRHHWDGSTSETIDEDVVAPVPFHFGELLYLSETALLTASIAGNGGVNAAVGHSTADFLHTATMKPVIVEDESGHVLTDPTILSDTGFDYTNPAAPEPANALLVISGLSTLAVLRTRLRHRSRASAEAVW